MKSGLCLALSALCGALSAQVTVRGPLASRVDACYAHHVAAADPLYYAEVFRAPSETRDWQGEFWGKYMLSAVPFAYMRGDRALQEKIAASVRAVLTCQEADGYIGNYAAGARAGGGGWDVWGNKYALLGLLVWHEYAHDAQVLAGAERLAGYLMGTFGPGRRELNATGCFRGLPSCSILEAIVKLYVVTGKQAYRDFADYIVRQMDAEGQGPRLLADAATPVRARVTGPQVFRDSSRKAYEQMSCYQGLVAYARATGERRALKAALKAAENIAQDELNIVGGASCSENWYGGAAKQTRTHQFENETCVLTTWMRLCGQLLEATGEARWADELEKTFYNAYLGAAKPDGTAFEVYAALSGRRHAGSDHCRMHVNCCTANGPRGYLAFFDSVLTAHEGAVAMNQYVSGEACVVEPVSGKPLTLVTYAPYPKVNEASVSYRAAERRRFTLKLRIPSWSKATTVTLNGVPVAGVAPGYVTLAREWACGDRVDLTFDFTPQVFERDNHFAFKIGPLVLARDRRFGDGDLCETIARHAWMPDPRESVRVLPTRTARADMFFTAVCLVPTGQHTKDPAERYPTVINLCDFASAGNTWTDDSAYRVWIPVECPLDEGN